MASKNCPETPRQKMIGMMYLMLTAMLALNVSAEVLNGFTMISTSLRASIDSAEDRTERLYRRFHELNEENPEKVGEWYARADSLRIASNSLYDYIQAFRDDMILLADRNADPNNLESLTNRTKADLNVAGQLAIHGGRGKELQRRLLEHRELLIRLTDNDSTKRVMYEALFDVDDANWVDARFRMMPLGAAVTVLTKYQNDVRIAEMDMVQFLQRQIDAGDIRVNQISAHSIPITSSFVMQGGMYETRIILAAEDTTATPTVIVNGREVPGGILRIPANTPGVFTYSGTVTLTGADGEPIVRPFNSQFTVGQPAATISNVDLNVVYRGVDNRFSISVPGVAAANVNVTAEGANVRQSGNFFIVNPARDGSIRINVAANINGRITPMGSQEFRVRQIPDPKAFIQYRDAGGVMRQIDIEGRLSRAAMRSPDFAVIASYGPDELIQANFNVVSFSVRTRIGAVPTQGNRLTPRQLQDIERLERGDVITFGDIRAVGPDGAERRLGNLQITLN